MLQNTKKKIQKNKSKLIFIQPDVAAPKRSSKVRWSDNYDDSDQVGIGVSVLIAVPYTINFGCMYAVCFQVPFFPRLL